MFVVSKQGLRLIRLESRQISEQAVPLCVCCHVEAVSLMSDITSIWFLLEEISCGHV